MRFRRDYTPGPVSTIYNPHDEKRPKHLESECFADTEGVVWYRRPPYFAWFEPRRDRKSGYWFTREEKENAFLRRSNAELLAIKDSIWKDRIRCPVVPYPVLDHGLDEWSPETLRQMLPSHRSTRLLSVYLNDPASELWTYLDCYYTLIKHHGNINVLPGNVNPAVYYHSQYFDRWCYFNGTLERFKLLRTLQYSRRNKSAQPMHLAEDGTGYPIDVLLGQFYYLDECGHFHRWDDHEGVWRSTTLSLAEAVRQRILAIIEKYNDVVLGWFINEENEFGHHYWPVPPAVPRESPLWRRDGADLSSHPLIRLTRSRLRYFQQYKLRREPDGRFLWCLDVPAPQHTGHAWHTFGKPAPVPTWNEGGSDLDRLKGTLLEMEQKRVASIRPLSSIQSLAPFELCQLEDGTLFYCTNEGQIVHRRLGLNSWISTGMQIDGFKEYLTDTAATELPPARHSLPRAQNALPESFHVPRYVLKGKVGKERPSVSPPITPAPSVVPPPTPAPPRASDPSPVIPDPPDHATAASVTPSTASEPVVEKVTPETPAFRPEDFPRLALPRRKSERET